MNSWILQILYNFQFKFPNNIKDLNPDKNHDKKLRIVFYRKFIRLSHV